MYIHVYNTYIYIYMCIYTCVLKTESERETDCEIMIWYVGPSKAHVLSNYAAGWNLGAFEQG